MKKTLQVYFVWDISTNERTPDVYAVEYKGEIDTIPYELREKVINQARRVAFERTGDRKVMLRTNEAFRPYSEDAKIVRVPHTTRPLKVWKGRTRKPIAEYEYGDEEDWYTFLSILTEKMGSNTFWRVNGRSIGWMNRSGHKYVEASTGAELLKAIYHEDIVRLYCGKRGNSFEINAPTHDTPMGSFYEFVPVSERTFNREV